MGHFRYAPPFLQQRPRPFQYFSLQHRRGTSAWLVLIESLSPVVSKHFHVSLHRDARHAKRFHDFSRLHRSIDDHLAGEHTETPNVLFIVLEYRQVPMNIDHLPCFFLNRDAVVDLGYPGGIRTAMMQTISHWIDAGKGIPRPCSSLASRCIGNPLP